MSESLTACVITVSDRSYSGKREDLSGPLLEELLKKNGFHVLDIHTVPDERADIVSAILKSIDSDGADLVVTTGGTGLSPRDITPEATLSVVERVVPGFSEFMRIKSLEKTPYASFSRGVCGIRRKSLIINLPGSPTGALENIEVLLDLLPGAVREIKGEIPNEE